MIFARSAIRVIGRRLPAGAPLGCQLATQQHDHAHEESGAHNHGWRDRLKILQHNDHLSVYPGKDDPAATVRGWSSRLSARLQAQQHASVAEGVGLNPVQIEELRDSLVV